jgi:ectoine hydroxylase-related dioxygenase (phytanoyl-CoA dioxygenase family)
MSAPAEIVFSARDWSAQRLSAAYERHGAVVVRDVVDRSLLESFNATLRRLMRARLNGLGRATSESDDLDALYAQLVAVHPRGVAELFTLVRHLIEHARLIFAPGVMELVQALLADTIVQAVPEACGIRIDSDTSTRDFSWHHDYSYLAMSQRLITGWMPMMPMTREMGWMRAVLGTHTSIAPVAFREEFARAGNFRGNLAYELRVDAQELEKTAVDLDDVQPGDIVFLHTLLLHRSGVNTSKRARWTVLPRYGDALDPAVVDRGWKAIGAPTERLFNTLHPDLVEIQPVPIA